MANILRNVDKIITSAPASKEIDLNNIQAAGGGNQVMTITTTNDGGGDYYFNQTITFSVTGTSALAGQSITKLEYAWDGGTKTVIANSNTGTFTHMETTTETYSSSPNYTEMHVLSLTATDSLGNTFTKDFSVNYTLIPHLKATGGTITDITDSNGKDWRVHTFTSNGSFEITGGQGAIEYLVVAGGGGGAGYHGGGGGAGGYRSSVQGESSGGLVGINNPESPLTLPNGNYQVIVGGGGDGRAKATQQDAGDGWPSSFHTITAVGGGGGAYSLGPTGRNGRSGGSGGGGSEATNGSGGSHTSGQGYSGGAGSGESGIEAVTGGGGGGAGEAGQNGSGAKTGGDGGNGLQSSINGTLNWYAGGGGGRGETTNGAGGSGGGGNGEKETSASTAGHAYTGGGGGGGHNTGVATGGKNGGSGIVIIRYQI